MGCGRGGEASGAQRPGGAVRALPVAVAQVAPRDLSRSVVVAGPVEPVRTIGVNALLAGTVLAVRVQEGDRVKEGQLLAELDARETRAQFQRAQAAAHGPLFVRAVGARREAIFVSMPEAWQFDLAQLAMPPLALPKREYMEHARKIWEELGLPALKPQAPWFGISLGEWEEDFDVMAQRAVDGFYWKTGEVIAQQRRNDVAMNTEVRRVKAEERRAMAVAAEQEMKARGIYFASR